MSMSKYRSLTTKGRPIPIDKTYTPIRIDSKLFFLLISLWVFESMIKLFLSLKILRQLRRSTYKL